mmetsp:Transcript_5264/g.14729  ORF Transcript_5264/g.14729 Transcript_5264/m.14729 type:complete len:202 (+) Transcript_5264:2379-2984(+)
MQPSAELEEDFLGGFKAIGGSIQLVGVPYSLLELLPGPRVILRARMRRPAGMAIRLFGVLLHRARISLRIVLAAVAVGNPTDPFRALCLELPRLEPPAAVEDHHRYTLVDVIGDIADDIHLLRAAHEKAERGNLFEAPHEGVRKCAHALVVDRLSVVGQSLKQDEGIASCMQVALRVVRRVMAIPRLQGNLDVFPCVLPRG